MKCWRTGALALGICFLTGCSSSGNLHQAPQEQVPKTAAEIKSETIRVELSSMSAEEKIGQLLMMDFRENADGSDMTVLNEDAKKEISTCHLGGVILFAENLDTQAQTKQLTEELQKVSELPLFIGIDEEGGLVSRLNKSNIPHDKIPPAAEMRDAAEAEAAGHSIGTILAELGVNVDFAPVADVNTNPQNPVIGNRAFSDDPSQAADMVTAFTVGLQGAGVSAAAKHFPGHGDTAADSHKGEVFVSHDLARMKEIEFVPFEKAIQAGVGMIMVGHINTPNATTDGLPASLSAQAMGWLREDLAYQGIVITDAMNMQAITDAYGVGESAVMAVLAGADIVLMPADLQTAFQALLDAKKDGRITEERLNESLQRILSLKYDKGLLD